MTGSFQGHASPRAADMPADIRDTVRKVRATTNPLGVKVSAKPAPPRRSRR